MSECPKKQSKLGPCGGMFLLLLFAVVGRRKAGFAFEKFAERGLVRKMDLSHLLRGAFR